MRLGIGSWAAAVLWGAAAWAAAEQAPPVVASPPAPPTFQLPAGAKVRVASTALPGGSIESRVVSSTDESLALMLSSEDPFAPGAGQVVIPRASLTGLQVSVGQRRYTLPGAVVGALVGAAAGAAAGVNPQDCGTDSDDFCSQGEAIAVSAVAGALLGALVGHLFKAERWQKVSVDVLAPRSAAGRGSRPAGVAARLAFRF